MRAPALVLNDGSPRNLGQNQGHAKVVTASNEGIPSRKPSRHTDEPRREEAGRSHNERQNGDDEKRHREDGQKALATERAGIMRIEQSATRPCTDDGRT